MRAFSISTVHLAALSILSTESIILGVEGNSSPLTNCIILFVKSIDFLKNAFSLSALAKAIVIFQNNCTLQQIPARD